MRRRGLLASAGAALAVSVAAAGSGGGVPGRELPAQAAPAERRPNVVVVMTDDQDLRSMDRMPAVGRLARTGTSFDNSLATLPLCAPSRATFLTGQYAHNHGVERNTGPGGGLDGFDESDTLAVALQGDGYRTALIGKYLNGYKPKVREEGLEDSVPPGWSTWRGVTDSTYSNWALNRDGNRLQNFGDRPADYQTDVLARMGERFIADSSQADDPFFLYLSLRTPHTVKSRATGKNPPPAPRHRGEFRNVSLPRSPGFNERDISDKPSLGDRARLSSREIDDLRGFYRDRGEALLAADEAVAGLRRRLRAEGELADTLFVFTSDNGYMLGEHRLVAKRALYEESLRVPLVIRGPGFSAGSTHQPPVGNIDLAPTILEAAGVAPPRPQDGVPLQSQVADPQVYRDRALLLRTTDFLSPGSVGEGVRERRHVLTRLDLTAGESFEELYDLRRDPYQLRNLSGAERADQVRERLERRLATLRNCAGAACR